MNRKIWVCLLLTTVIGIGCSPAQDNTTATRSVDEPQAEEQQYAPPQGEEIGKVVKSAEEWKEELTDKEYYVLREAGTERAFTGDLLNNKQEGVYTCRGCGLPLFDSKAKFKSGTGWPSFYQPIRPQYVTEKPDNSYGMQRTEILCKRCDGHLGHVFEDGPEPTGLRYCINSVSLDFVSQEQVEKHNP